MAGPVERGLAVGSTRAVLCGDECDEVVERKRTALEAHGTGRKSVRLFAEISLVERNVITLPLITTQNTHRLRKQTRIRPTCSQTETSSRAALDVSTALKYCTSQASLAKRPAESTTLLYRAT